MILKKICGKILAERFQQIDFQDRFSKTDFCRRILADRFPQTDVRRQISADFFSQKYFLQTDFCRHILADRLRRQIFAEGVVL